MKLEFLMELSATLDPSSAQVGAGPTGNRRIVAVTGGQFEGPRLQGTVQPGGGDWLVVDSKGVARLDVRVTLETDDGALIYVQYYGVGRDDPDKPDGDHSEYGGRYFMTAPRFETGDERYYWINEIVCVGEGRRTEDGVAYQIYAVVND